MTVVVLLALALLAAVLARRRSRAAVDLLWLVLLALVLAPVLTVFYDARYAAPVLPPLFALAGYGAWLGAERLRRRQHVRQAGAGDVAPADHDHERAV